MSKIPIETIWLPRPSSKYSGCYPLHFEKRISNLLETDNFVHLFSGSCKSGHTVDIKKDLIPDTVANAESLPFSDNYFDGGFADPPYTEKFAKELYNCNYPCWSKWTNELVRVVKNDCKIGIMQNYIVPRLKNCKYESILVVLLRIKQFPKIVTVQRKCV